MRAGLYKDIIEVYKPNVEVNEYGEENVSYTFVCTTRARVIHNRGSRASINDNITLTLNKVFEVHNYVYVDDYDRIKYNGRFYRVLNVDPDPELNKKVITTEVIDD